MIPARRLRRLIVSLVERRWAEMGDIVAARVVLGIFSVD
jgi:hypothetical protein